MSRSLLKKLTNQRLGALLLLTLLTATTAWADTETVKYIDADGNEQSCTEFTNLTDNETSLSAGWYVVNSDISYTGTVTLTGDVHLILKDGCTMNVGTSDAKISGIGITSPPSVTNTLTIYGQSGQTGKLNIYSISNNTKDWGSIAIFGSVTVNGGNVTVRHYGGYGNGIYASNSLTVNGGNVDVVSDQMSAASIREAITINGGNVTANGNADGLCCTANNGSITINGGNVTANGNNYGFLSGTITLGWRNPTDRITVNKYSGTVKVTDGKKLYYGTNFYSGTLNDEQKTAIAGKTLQPALSTTYVNADGNLHDAVDAIVLSPDQTTLAAGTYAAYGNTNYTSGITLNGDVTLILADNCQMNIGTSESRISSEGIKHSGFPTLTISSQTLGNDMGTLSIYTTGGNNHAIFTGAITINGGNVTADTDGYNAYALYAASTDVTINGGTVSATTIGSGAKAIYAYRNFAYNGGNVTATGTSGYAIEADGKQYTFNWRNPADRITIGATGLYAPDGATATVADGKYFYNGTEVLSGTITDLTKLAGKTLVPAFVVNIADGIEHGTVNVDKDYWAAGQTVTLNITPAEGYSIGTVKYNDCTEDHTITPTDNGYTFTMPASDVTVSAMFNPLNGNCGRFDVNDGKDVTWAVADTDGNGTYETLTISGEGEIYNYNDSNQPWVAYKSEITTAVIEEGVTIIGHKLLYQYPALTSVSIASSVTTIGYSAFYECSNLTTVNGASGVTNLDKMAFGETAWYNNLPDGLTYVGHVAYLFKGDATSVTLDENTTQIADDAFRKSKITSIDVPASVTYIGDYAFQVSAVSTAVVHGDIECVGFGAFRYSALNTIVFLGNVKYFGDHAFQTSQLKKFYYLGTTLPNISNNAFESSKTTVVVPANASNDYLCAWQSYSQLPNGKIVRGYTVTCGTDVTATSTDNGPLVVKGETVTLSYSGTVPEGYIFAGYTVEDADKNVVDVSETEGVYSFSMPESNVTVSAKFTADIATHWQASDSRDGSTAEKAYIISTTTGLNLLASEVNSGNSYKNKYFMLGDDITYTHTTDWNDATSKENNYTAIGKNNKYFEGHFDGNGKTVRGIRIYKSGETSGDDYYLGLFGFIGNASEIKNVILADARITGRACVGGIVGGSNGGPITNCHVLSDVTINFVASEQAHGGIAGVTSGNIVGCTSAASVTGYINAGGIVGYNYGTVSNCLYLGSTINGCKSVGAIVGQNENNCTVQNCYYTSTNIMGRNNSGNQLDYTVSAVGHNAGTVTNSGLAYSIALDTDVSIAGDQTVYNVSGLTAYGNTALSYNDGTTTTCYSCKGVTVTLSSTPTEGYTTPLIGYSVKNGSNDDVKVTEDNGVYTFTMPANNVAVSAMYTPYAACVIVGEEKTYYEDFSEAETAAKAAYVAAQGETAAVVPTLKLYDDIDYGEQSLQIGNGTDAFEMTFDLNGHRFYGEGYSNAYTSNINLIYIAPNAKLTVVDTSTGDNKGSIDCTKYNEQCIINFGTLALNGGIVKYSGGQGYVVCNYDGGLLTLDGATINGKPTSGTVHSTGILNAYGSTCNIVSGSIEDCDIAIQNDKGDVNMGGGVITDCRYGIYLNNSNEKTLNISGGTISKCSVEGIMLGDQGNLNMTAFPAFSGNSTDIEIRDQRKIKFCAGNYTAPTSKIKVTVDYDGTDPYVFTEGYSTNVKSGNNVIAFDDVFAVTVENKAENATFSFVGEAVIAAPKTFSFAEGQEWSTWCDQYEWTKPEGIEVYDVTGVSNSNVSISLIENSVIPAYKPVLLKKKDSGSLESTIYSVGTAPESYDSDKYVLTTDVSGATLVGNTKYEENIWPCIYFTELKTYVLYNGKFVLADENSGLPAHRFWINLDIDGAEINNNNKSRSLSIGGDGTTEIDTIDSGQWTVDSWYSLDGRKLEGVPAKKGLYIHNGKKEVVK